MANRLRGAYATGSGMNGLWSPAAFASVVDYSTWEVELLEDEDIRRHIKAGDFVPINIQSDGVYEIEVRAGTAGDPAVLSDREAKYSLVASELYLFRSTGRLCVSGIEFVEKEPGDQVGSLDLPKGDYSIKVHLISWDEEPGMVQTDGKPMKDALPDFLAMVNPLSGSNTSFRTEVETFPPPK